jgi:hypothetical protein
MEELRDGRKAERLVSKDEGGTDKIDQRVKSYNRHI